MNGKTHHKDSRHPLAGRLKDILADTSANLFVERAERLDAIYMVGYGGCLAAAVHREEGIAHIDTADGER